jgi:hypothetical protein
MQEVDLGNKIEVGFTDAFAIGLAEGMSFMSPAFMQRWTQKKIAAIFERNVQQVIDEFLPVFYRDRPEANPEQTRFTAVPTMENGAFQIRVVGEQGFSCEGIFMGLKNVLSPLQGISAKFDGKGKRVE